MIKEKAFYSYSRKISYNENLKTRKRRNEFPFPVDGSIGTKHRSILTLHFLHEVVENPNGSNDGCSRSFNAYRSEASPSFSSLLLSSSILYARLVCPPFCLFGVLFSEGRLTYRFREGSGHQGWCSLAFAVVSAWSKSDVASSTGEESFFFDRSNRCVSTHVT